MILESDFLSEEIKIIKEHYPMGFDILLNNTDPLSGNIVQLAILIRDRHKSFVKNWEDGKPVKIWLDDDENICVKYESGKWWHYKYLDLPFPSWWI